MARILAISSQVARGTVGLSIIVPALHALGHEVIGLPTVLLSNHPGHTHSAGMRIEPLKLASMFDALDFNGWLGGFDGVLSGYLPTPSHVAFAREAVIRTRKANPASVYLCDPVLGDDPKGLYIDEDAARSIVRLLLPYAHYATPNRFELSYLVQSDIRSIADVLSTGERDGPVILATSIPAGIEGEMANTLQSPHAKLQTRVTRRAGSPHGTGDLFSALALSALLDGNGLAQTLAFATAGVDAVLAASAGHDQLLISALPTKANPPKPWPVEPL